MSEKESLFENIKRRLGAYEKVSPKEYLYYIGVARLPKLSYLQNVEGNVLENIKLVECKKVVKTVSEENLKQVTDAYEEFKNKDEKVLQEQADKDYENRKFRYDNNMMLIERQEELLKGALSGLDAIAKYQELADVKENLEKNLNLLAEQKKNLEVPKVETVAEYKERVGGLYEKAIKEIQDKINEEKDYTLEKITEYAEDFVKGLENVGENK